MQVFLTIRARLAKLLCGGHLRSSSLVPFLSEYLIISQGNRQIDITWLSCSVQVHSLSALNQMYLRGNAERLWNLLKLDEKSLSIQLWLKAGYSTSL